MAILAVEALQLKNRIQKSCKKQLCHAEILEIKHNPDRNAEGVVVGYVRPVMVRSQLSWFSGAP